MASSGAVGFLAFMDAEQEEESTSVNPLVPPDPSHMISGALFWRQAKRRLCQRVVATMCTLIDHGLWTRVDPHEIRGGAWSDVDHAKAPHMHALAQRFNRVALWSASEVIQAPVYGTSSARIIARLLNIAHELIGMGNFLGSAAVLAGLNNVSVQRLKTVWRGLKPRVRQSFDQLEEFFCPVGNFKVYRAALEERTGMVTVPYVAVHLRDVIHVMDAAVGDDEPEAKEDAVKQCVDKLLAFQAPPFLEALEPEHSGLYAYVWTAKHLNDTGLYRRSTLLQPLAPELATTVPYLGVRSVSADTSPVSSARLAEDSSSSPLRWLKRVSRRGTVVRKSSSANASAPNLLDRPVGGKKKGRKGGSHFVRRPGNRRNRRPRSSSVDGPGSTRATGVSLAFGEVIAVTSPRSPSDSDTESDKGPTSPTHTESAVRRRAATVTPTPGTHMWFLDTSFSSESDITPRAQYAPPKALPAIVEQ